MQTDEFLLTLGVNPGYNHANEATKPITLAVDAWAKAAEAEFAESGVYVSATAIPGGKSIYLPQWGCPVGGEDVVVLVGTRNPEFIKDGAAWKDAARRVATAAGKTLEQKVVYLTFTEVQFDYIKIE